MARKKATATKEQPAADLTVDREPLPTAATGTATLPPPELAKEASAAPPVYAADPHEKISVSLSDHRGGPSMHLLRSHRYRQMQVRFDGRAARRAIPEDAHGRRLEGPHRKRRHLHQADRPERPLAVGGEDGGGIQGSRQRHPRGQGPRPRARRTRGVSRLIPFPAPLFRHCRNRSKYSGGNGGSACPRSVLLASLPDHATADRDGWLSSNGVGRIISTRPWPDRRRV